MEIIPNYAHHHHHVRSTGRSKRKREDVKVVYISSPVKVMTTASRFRALVQELTGQDSNISRFVETSNNNNNNNNNNSNGASYYNYDSQTFLDRRSGEPEPRRDSPTSSESLLEPPFDDVLIGSTSSVEESFLGMFPSSFSFQAPEFDVLGDYDAL